MGAVPILGKAHRFGDDISTDAIIAGKYKFKTLDMKELSRHLLESEAPGLAERLEQGDFLVAGRNFGCGSSREQAPLVIKAAGVAAVLAKSFARIFFRNAVNVGLPVVECDTDRIETGDELEVDFEKGIVSDRSHGFELRSRPLPPVMLAILNDGGLVAHVKKHGSIHVPGSGDTHG